MRMILDTDTVNIVESSDGFLEYYETNNLSPKKAREMMFKIADDYESDGVRVLWADNDLYHGESVLILQGDNFMVSIELEVEDD